MGNSTSKLPVNEAKYHARIPEDPTPKDVYTVRQYLLTKVPAELANIILDKACYWPKLFCGLDTEGSPLVVRTAGEQDGASSCCLLSPRLSEWIMANGALSDKGKVKAVRFTIVSHDQGWASENDFPVKYQGSWTWFEAVIVRNFRDAVPRPWVNLDERIKQAVEARKPADSRLTTVVNPHSSSGADTWRIQSNVRAQNEPVRHNVVWNEDVEEDMDEEALFAECGAKSGRGFVRSLEMGDRVAVIARAKYPGWENHIEEVYLDVYYSV